LKAAGATVTCFDLAVSHLDRDLIAEADLIAFYVPMHTATRIAGQFIPRVRSINPNAHLCAYGLYAPLNADYLRGLGVTTILGGEFEEGLVAVYKQLPHAARSMRHLDYQPPLPKSTARFRKRGRHNLNRSSRAGDKTSSHPIDLACPI
jgi:hypothetical protein